MLTEYTSTTNYDYTRHNIKPITHIYVSVSTEAVYREIPAAAAAVAVPIKPAPPTAAVRASCADAANAALAFNAASAGIVSYSGSFGIASYSLVVVQLLLMLRRIDRLSADVTLSTVGTAGKVALGPCCACCRWATSLYDLRYGTGDVFCDGALDSLFFFITYAAMDQESYEY